VQQYRIVDKERVGVDQQLTVKEIQALISEAGGEAVQRDGFYRISQQG